MYRAWHGYDGQTLVSSRCILTLRERPPLKPLLGKNVLKFDTIHALNFYVAFALNVASSAGEPYDIKPEEKARRHA